jgi:hypothetical protein
MFAKMGDWFDKDDNPSPPKKSGSISQNIV